jgi:hypothetical protein
VRTPVLTLKQTEAAARLVLECLQGEQAWRGVKLSNTTFVPTTNWKSCSDRFGAMAKKKHKKAPASASVATGAAAEQPVCALCGAMSAYEGARGCGCSQSTVTAAPHGNDAANPTSRMAGERKR